MKTAIIMHRLPTKEEYYGKEGDSESNCHWLPWLQKQLIVQGVLAQTPEMPTPYDPNYIEWKKVLMQFEINEETILVGHSCGGGFITRFLSEENIKVGKVVLVAPWIDPRKEITKNMFDFEIDKNIVSKTKDITIFESTNDDEEVKESIKLIKNGADNIKVVTFKDYGHFCLRNMKTREFPELLEECLK
jgi:predicted alpha/beta hydrolase family esterase